MSGGLPFVDILIFAIIAIFLGLRLRSVLGKRTGFEQEFTRDPEAVEKMTGDEPQDVSAASAINGEGISAIQRADPYFSEPEFIQGATAAYAMILSSFAEGDVEALKPLLGYEMNAGFAGAIRQRLKAGETLEIDIKSQDKTEVVSAKITDGVAAITVECRSQQQRLLKAENGDLLDGEEGQVETFIDRWVFERDVSSQDPNWLLVETESLNA